MMIRRDCLRLLGAAAVLGGSGVDAASPSYQTGAGYALMWATLYNHPASSPPGADGATGVNLHGFAYIEEQARGGNWVRNGRARGRADWLRTGWLELDYGLGKQRADGCYPGPDSFHSTTFFVEALARACLLDPAGATAARKTGLLRAAKYIARSEVFSAGIRGNLQYAHRRYLVAAAFCQTVLVTGDDGLMARANSQIDDGLALQRGDGVNPERGGPDVGYQMLGLLMATRCLPALSAKRAERVRAMLRRGADWELARVRADGSVDPAGSTRTMREVARNGEVKAIPYDGIADGMAMCADALGEARHLDAAARIARAQKW